MYREKGEGEFFMPGWQNSDYFVEQANQLGCKM